MPKPQKANIANIFSNEPVVKPKVLDPAEKAKKQMIFHMPETAKKQFDHLAIEIGKTKQALMAEAVNDLFVKYGKPPIA